MHKESSKPEVSLIITADDFGFSKGVNKAIAELASLRKIGSTSLLVNMEESIPAIEVAQKHALDLGWHVNLTLHRPVSPPHTVPSLVDSQGKFFPLRQFLWRLFLKKIKMAEVKRELEAQLNIFAKFGITISHVDGHQHIHLFPGISHLLCDLLKDFPGIFVRVPREEGSIFQRRVVTRLFLNLFEANHPRFWKHHGFSVLPFYGISLLPNAGTLKAWEEMIILLPKGVSEVMVHPSSLSSDNHHLGDHYPGDRFAEYELLKSDRFSETLTELGADIIGFRTMGNQNTP